MRIFLITCILLSLGITGVFAQNSKSAEYDFTSTGQEELRVPFDQPFEFRCKNIADSIREIQVKIYELRKINYKSLHIKGQPPPITLEILKANKESCPLIYESQMFKRNKDYSAQTLSFVIPLYLSPNSSYVISIEGHINKVLSDKEKEKAIAGIMGDPDFTQTVNDIISKQITSPTPSKSWAVDDAAIHKAANDAVKTVNTDYSVTDDYKKQLEGMLEVTESVINIRHKLRAAKQNFYAIDVIAVLDANRKALEAKKAAKEKEIAAADNTKLLALNQELQQIVSDLVKIDNERSRAKREHDKLNNQDVPISKMSPSIVNKLQGVDWLNLQKADLDFLESGFASDLGNENFSQLPDGAIDKRSTLFQQAADQYVDDLVANIADLRESFEFKFDQSIFGRSLNGNTLPTSLEHSLKMHVTLDLGYAYVANVDRFNLYAGMNIYMRAIDTSLPLKNYRKATWDFIGARTSLLLGVSLQSIQKEGIRKGIISNDMALVTGVGFRLLPWFKVNGGAYLFYALPTDPLASKNNYHVKAAPFISLSIDFNVGSFLESFGNGHVANIFKH